MTDSTKKINHSILLQIAKTLMPDFKNVAGLCEGINSVFLQAVATGPTEEKEFFDRLKFLTDYLSISGNTIVKLKEDIEAVYQSKIIPETKPPLTDAQKTERREAIENALTPDQKDLQEKLKDVLAFFNAVTLEHNMRGLEVFKTRHQTDKDNIHSVVASEALEKAGKYVHSTTLGVIVANKKELAAYFDDIAASINTQLAPLNERATFLLSSDDHTISIFFDNSIPPGKWHFFDVNHLPLTEKGIYCAQPAMDSTQLADFVFKGFSDDKNNNVNTAFLIRRISTQGYDLALMEDDESDQKFGEKLPAKGKLYLSKKGAYIFLDIAGIEKKGNLRKNHERDLNNLKDKLYDFSFKTDILELISKDSNTPLMVDELDKKINTASNALLYKTKQSDNPNNTLANKQNSRVYDALYFAIALLYNTKQSDNPNNTLANKQNSRGYDALYFAIFQGQFTLVNTLIQEKVNLNVQWKIDKGEPLTPLVLAAGYGHTDIVNALIAAEGNTKKDLPSALKNAARSGFPDTVSALLSHGGFSPAALQPAFLNAAVSGHTDVIKILYSAGARDLKKSNNEVEKLEDISALVMAARNGHTDAVNALLEMAKQEKVPYDVKELSTALFDTARNNHPQTVNALIKAIPPENLPMFAVSGLFRAASQGHAATIRALIENAKVNISMPNQDGNTPLMIAAAHGHTEAVNALWIAGTDINLINNSGANALIRAAEKGHTDTVNFLIKAGAKINLIDKYGYNALMAASKSKHINTVRALILAGAELPSNADAQASKPEEKVLPFILSLSVIEGYPDMITKAIAAGADINEKDAKGMTLLMIAADSGNLDMVNSLLSFGAERTIITPDEEETALVFAIVNGHLKIVNALINDKKTEVVNACLPDDFSMLMLAAQNGKLEIVQALLKAGAKIDAVDADGNNALNFASKNGHKEIVALLTPRDSQELTPSPKAVLFHLPVDTPPAAATNKPSLPDQPPDPTYKPKSGP